MPVRKFRTIEEMNEADRQRRWNVEPEQADRRMLGIWQLSEGLCPPLNFPKGVHKFRSIEEMNAFKQRYEDERIAHIKAERVVKK